MHTPAVQYVLPVAAMGLAMRPVMAEGQAGVPSSLLLFVAAALISAAYGGRRAGLLTALLGAFVSLCSTLGSVSDQATESIIASLQVSLFVVVVLFIVSLVDRRQGTQDEGRDYSDLLGALVDDPDSAVCMLDREGRVTHLNVAAEGILGWMQAEVLGKDLHQVMHSAAQAACPAAPGEPCTLHAILSPGKPARAGDAELTTRDGTAIHVAYSSSPIFGSEGVQGTVFTFHDATEDLRAIDSLRKSEERYRSLVEASPDGIVVTDLYGYITTVNQRAAGLYGYVSPGDMVGRRAMELIALVDRGRALEDARTARAAGGVRYGEYTALKPDGSTFPVEIRVTIIKDDKGDPEAFIQACTDITERRRTEETLQVSEICAATQNAATVALAQSVTVGEAVTNLIRTVGENADWDAAIAWLLDERDSVLRYHSVWRRESLDVAALEDVSRQLSHACGDDLPGRVWESGTTTWIHDIVSDTNFPRALVASRIGLRAAVGVPVLLDGSVRGVMEFFSRDAQKASEDLTRTMSTISAQLGQFMKRKEAENALEHQARHDALTTLPNRMLLRERLERAFLAARGQDVALALLLMDLDRFKEVNDTLGHHYGDLLLQQVGLRVRSALRNADTVARLGGDEFAVLLPATDLVGARVMADKILKIVEQPYRLEAHQVDVGVSIGIAVFPQHGDDVQTLMQRADIAMYAAKRATVGHAVYAAEQDDHSPDRLALMAELRQVIEQKRLLVHYQPKINLKTGHIESVEALARWHHPRHGMIPPDQFIPLAEKSGLIRPLSYSVLDQALRQCRNWQQAGMGLNVAVNLSAENLHDPQLVTVISELLEMHGLDPGSLTGEITESAIMGRSAQASEAVARLHDMGIRISVDDFGIGHSSLAYLRQLPVHEVKIDKSFVMDMARQDDDAFIARSVIDLGHKLGLEVVAEGVETSEIRGMLDSMDCDHAQGFHLSRPLPASELITWFAQLNARAATAQLTKMDVSPRARRTGA